MCQEPFRAPLQSFLNIKEVVPEQVSVISAATMLVFYLVQRSANFFSKAPE